MKVPMPQNLKNHNYDPETKNDDQNTKFAEFYLLKKHVMDIILQKINT